MLLSYLVFVLPALKTNVGVIAAIGEALEIARIL